MNNHIQITLHTVCMSRTKVCITNSAHDMMYKVNKTFGFLIWNMSLNAVTEIDPLLAARRRHNLKLDGQFITGYLSPVNHEGHIFFLSGRHKRDKTN